ncbi:hypothetical protein [Mesorhizobium sp. M0227]|uniref:hypothetical protein n=1 Tax=Mesorhizobium sp. M0227 TaxID=2956922 RepID=UPI003338C6E3
MGVTILRTSGGKLDRTNEKALNALIERIGKGSPKVLVHLHGGLVDQASAENMAGRLSGTGDAAYNAPADWEQVYVVWRTGTFETLARKWKDLATNDRLYKAILKRLLSFVSGKVRVSAIAGRSLAQERVLTPANIQARLASGSDDPFGDVDALYIAPTGSRSAIGVADEADMESELKLELQLDTDIEEVASGIEESLAAGHPKVARKGSSGDAALGKESFDRLDTKIQKELKAQASTLSSTRGIISGEIVRKIITHGVKIGMRSINRYREGHDHGLHATIVEEIARELYAGVIGSAIWSMMRDNASEHFEPTGLGSRLFAAIADNPRAKLLVVAHSAGSIFASDLLLWADKHKPDLETDLVFLAPAVRTLKFAAALGASEARIRRFRMFAMQDAVERRDALLGTGLGFIYPSSLLYLVSGLFEQGASDEMSDAPLLGMQRFQDPGSSWLNDAREGPPLQRVRAFLAAGPDRMVFSKVTGGDGLNCDAVSHGAFDDEIATLKSVATFFA